MKKALFIHDHPFVYNSDENIYYDGSGGCFTAMMWNRYLEVFDHLTVIGREKKDFPNKLVSASSKNVDFFLIDDFKRNIDKKLKQNQVKEKLNDCFDKVDFAICRLPSTLGSIGVNLCVEKKIPYMIEVVGCPFDAYWHHGHFAGKILAGYERYKLRKIIKNSKNTVYVTQKFLQNRYPSNGKTIGISDVNLKSIVDSQKALHFYNKPSDIFNIGYIGTFHTAYKGHKEALKAIKQNVDNGFTNIRLHLVGSGDYSHLQNLAVEMGIEKYINFIGLVEEGEKGIFPFIDNLHLYIHTSKTEGLPRVVVEAMSRGKLVLGSNVGGIPELISSQFLHEVGDWKHLAKQIHTILTENEHWKEIILNNLKVASEFTEEQLQSKRVQFIKKSLEK